MHAVFRTLAREFKEAVPPTLFFLVAFHVAALIRSLTEESLGITPGVSTLATIGALIVGKTILVLNKLRVTNCLSRRPLVFGVIWKTFIFGIVTTLFQFVEELVPLVSKYGSAGAATENVIAEVVWPRFWANHLVLALFLLIYCSAVELIRVFGAERMKQVFFGPAKPRRPSRVRG